MITSPQSKKICHLTADTLEKSQDWFLRNKLMLNQEKLSLYALEHRRDAVFHNSQKQSIGNTLVQTKSLTDTQNFWNLHKFEFTIVKNIEEFNKKLNTVYYTFYTVILKMPSSLLNLE